MTYEAGKLPNEIKRVLVDTLADIYRTQNQAEELLEDMDFPPQTRPRWDASQDLVAYWRQVVRALELGALRRDGVLHLVETVLRRYPGNQDLHKVREFLGEERRERDGADGNADTLYRTVEFVGSEDYPELLRLVREVLDADAVQLYVNHRQAAYRVAELPRTGWNACGSGSDASHRARRSSVASTTSGRPCTHAFRSWAPTDSSSRSRTSPTRPCRAISCLSRLGAVPA